MPRRARSITGGYIYHVLNRANASIRIFDKSGDFAAFESVLDQAYQRTPIRILAYCVMPTHWHMLLWPQEGQEQALSDFMRWLTVTHTQRWHAAHGTSGSGHLYQGRFKSFPVQDDWPFLRAARYVERNALRASLVQRAEDWRWSSLWRRTRGRSEDRALLSPWPIPILDNWLDWVNTPQTDQEVEALRKSVRRGSPFGEDAWVAKTIRDLSLEHTIRNVGRPEKGDGSHFSSR